MSYQTKEQSIGYILKAMIDTGSNRNELREVYLISKQGIKNVFEESQDNRMNNYTTEVILQQTLRTIEKDDEYIANAVSNLYYGYDRFTVEEAGDFYEAFAVILR